MSFALSTDRIPQGGVGLVRIGPLEAVRSVSGSFLDHDIYFYPDKSQNKYAGFLAVDLDCPPGDRSIHLKAVGTDGRAYETVRTVRVNARDFPTQKLTLPESKVTLSPEDLDRHNRESERIQKAFKNAEPKKLWDDNFTRPSTGEISTPFGVRRILNKQPKSPHSGIDFRSPAGKPVPAAGSGIIALTGDHFFSGRTVLIDHGTGVFTMYFHLSEVDVKDGERVSRGQIIGKVGSTGRSTGPHLHWGVRVNGQRIDPLSFLKLFGGQRP